MTDRISQVLGILQTGHYIQIGMGVGFYVDEIEYQRAQQRADETGKVQFIGIDHNGRTLHSESRDTILEVLESEINLEASSAGVRLIAWIMPNAAKTV